MEEKGITKQLSGFDEPLSFAVNVGKALSLSPD